MVRLVGYDFKGISNNSDSGLFPSVGDTSRQRACFKRQQIHRNQCLRGRRHECSRPQHQCHFKSRVQIILAWFFFRKIGNHKTLSTTIYPNGEYKCSFMILNFMKSRLVS